MSIIYIGDYPFRLKFTRARAEENPCRRRVSVYNSTSSGGCSRPDGADMQDRLVRGIFEKVDLRAAVVYVTETARTAEGLHLSGETASRALAHGLVAVALMSTSIKDKEKISLQYQWEGPLGGMLLDADSHGNIRGFTNKKILGDIDGSFAPLEDAFGGGSVNVIRSTPERIIYQGTVSALNRHVVQDAASYLTFSEQIPSAMASGAAYGNNRIEFAGGFLVQSLPGSDDKRIEALREAVKLEKVEEKILQTRNVQEVLTDLVPGEEFKILDSRPVRFKCNCSEKKVEEMIRVLGKDDVRSIINKDGNAEVTCHFCGKIYIIEKNRLKKIVE